MPLSSSTVITTEARKKPRQSHDRAIAARSALTKRQIDCQRVGGRRSAFVAVDDCAAGGCSLVTGSDMEAGEVMRYLPARKKPLNSSSVISLRYASSNWRPVELTPSMCVFVSWASASNESSTSLNC